MQRGADAPIRLLALDSADAFDTVDVNDIESCRRALGMMPVEFAEHLGWAQRKYQRVLESVREDGFADRDVALAVRGLMDVLLGPDEAEATALTIVSALPADANDGSFFDGRSFSHILSDTLKECPGWTAQVTPHLLELIANRAGQGKRITYGQAAVTLEENEKTRRVWPRTLYGMPLSVICKILISLGQETGVRIPLLSAIVVRGSGEPGQGLDGMIRQFVRQYENGEQARDLMVRLRRDRKGLVQQFQQEVFEFSHWSGVLRALGLRQP